MSDPAERFQDELAVLRDRLVGALREDNIADVKDGLGLYSNLITTVLDQFRRYEEVTGITVGDFRSFYGREMRWLEEDVRTFFRAASTDPMSDAADLVLTFLRGVLVEALSRGEQPAFRSLLKNYRFAWSTARRHGPQQGWPKARSSILLALEGLGERSIRHGGRRPAEQGKQSTAFAHLVIAELVQLMKNGVDDGSTDDLQAAGFAFRETLRYATERGHRYDENGPEPTKLASIPILKKAGVLAIEAWIIMRHEAGKSAPSESTQLISTVRQISAQLSWAGYLAAKSDFTADLFGSTWWETGLWEYRRSGILAFDSYLDKAYVTELMEGDAEIPTVDSPSDDGRYLVERLLKTIDAYEAEDGWRAPSGSQPDAQRVEQVREALTTLSEELRKAEEEVLLELEPVPERVESFRNAVLESWSSAQHLSSLVRSTPWPEETRGIAEGEGPEAFGINTFVSKDFFVERPNVFADPSDLGREFGDALGRGESEQILERLRAALPRFSVSLEEYPKTVKSTVDNLIWSGLSPTVLIVNSWDLLIALRELDIEPEGKWATADLDDAPRLRDTNTPVLLRYSEGEDACIVADFRHAIQIQHQRAEPGSYTDRILADGRLLTGVSPIDNTRARQILDANPGLIKSADSETEEGATRRLMKRVHVRVLEWILVEAINADAGVVFQVEGID